MPGAPRAATTLLLTLVLALPVAVTAAVALAVTTPAAAGAAAAPAGQPQPPQEEFIPIDELPPGDQMPAAPLLIAAYAIAWAAVFGYLWTIWRRLMAVETEVRDLSRRTDEGAREP